MFTARQRRYGLVAALLCGVATLGVAWSLGAVQPFATHEQADATGTDPVEATMIGALDAPPAAAARATTIDPVTTSAVAAPILIETAKAETPKSEIPKAVAKSTAASPAFLAALELVDAGSPADAFDGAAALTDPLERRVAQWAAIYYGGGKVELAKVEAFSAEAPDFTVGPVFRTRFEQALMRAAPGNADIVAKLGGAWPNTLGAQIALAKAYAADGQTKRAAGIARSIWVDNFLDKDGETRVLNGLGELLTPKDHWDRAVHLMMHDRATGAERLSSLLTPAQRSLMVARNATSRNAKDAKALLDKVDSSLTGHPVYIFTRAQRAFRADLFESAIDWMAKQAGEPPDAAEWWYLRRDIVRKLLAQGEVKLAYRAADEYRKGPEGRMVEAHFHAGWIALSFLKDADAAASHFTAMAGISTLSDSVTQANYWLARALKAKGDTEGAKAALAIGAEHPTVYYGLLARAELGEKGALIRSMPEWQASEPVFEAREIVRAIRLLADTDHARMALPLLRGLYPRLTDGAELLLAARLAQQLDAHNLAITIADVAERKGWPLDLFNFPRDALPASFELASIDKAAVFAVTRQESRFQTDAISSAGARGLMQLMPATARETADKIGLSYSRDRLTSDPAYNALLGSTYLKAQLDRYDGSLLLAAAAYNAGAGNANKWINAYGDPRSDKVDPVLWVELIPFQETRLYVKRVLGNYLVYRARQGDTEMTLNEALRAIPH